MRHLARVPRLSEQSGVVRSGHGSMPVHREARHARGTRADCRQAAGSTRQLAVGSINARHAVVAQLAEQRVFNPQVLGSMPSDGIAVLRTTNGPTVLGRIRAEPFANNGVRIMPITRGWQRDIDEHSLADQLKAERAEKLEALRAKPVFRDNETLAEFTIAALSRMGYYVTGDILLAIQRIDATDEEKANVADGIELHALVSRKITASYGKYMGTFADSRIGMAIVCLWNARAAEERPAAMAGD